MSTKNLDSDKFEKNESLGKVGIDLADLVKDKELSKADVKGKSDPCARLRCGNQNSDEQDMYKDKLREELLVCGADGVFNLQVIGEVAHILSAFSSEHGKCQEVADKLWSGIIDQSKYMTIANIIIVFSTFPHLAKN